MAQATTNILHVETPGILARIGNFMVQIAENNHRIRKVEFLNNLSDEELAARGIRREDIVHHVFSDMLHI
ncbi:DUF1127 domain-containing protein [Marinovum sp. 2_MG-2023]|uniref:DUF1127 domain-containing protein n=1 Tax=Roseobacteraceae TaxID=2854170 RepID=UPI001FD1F2E9|nr:MULTISPECIES: DUF1127 domain-containing protein [Roseobacteraceae]MCJ7874187.1 DUF1127 domain-containing protein [Phaeobacter sp. J2-8]MDO6730205.1 DUF1127 domain-containing protein [Marinovum sp. 2_MG-2023]MDO6778943.1 DUF1127 domain-containing protein [Marinovum sp. 1_MG-2023]